LKKKGTDCQRRRTTIFHVQKLYKRGGGKKDFTFVKGGKRGSLREELLDRNYSRREDSKDKKEIFPFKKFYPG